MPDRSEFAEPEQRRGVPRWIFEAWMWASVLATALAIYGCPVRQFWAFCSRFSNTVGQAFELFPGTLVGAFVGVAHGFPGAIGCVVVCAVACHWIARKTLPARLSWAVAATLVVAWIAVSLVTEYVSLGMLFSTPAAS